MEQIRSSKHNKNATGFFIFSKEIRHHVHKACPFFSSLDISKVISEQWKGLPESERMRYREMAKNMASSSSPTRQKSPSVPSPVKQELLPPIESFGLYPMFDKIQYAVLPPTTESKLIYIN